MDRRGPTQPPARSADQDSLSWLPPGVALAWFDIDDPGLEAAADGTGWQTLPTSATPMRRRAFIAGRLAARAALSAAGADTTQVGRKGCFPLWPSGWCGSITHSGGYAAAVVGRSPPWGALGVDLEAAPNGHAISAMQWVLTARELELCRTSSDPLIWARVWAAKEAAYKCVSALGHDIALRQLETRWSNPGRGSVAVAQASFSAEIDVRICERAAVVLAVASWVGAEDAAATSEG